MGRPLVVLLSVCTIAFPVLLILLWPRLRHPVLGRLGRLGLVVASQFSAVLLVAAMLNDYGYFYASWGELFSGAAQAAAITSPGGPGAQGVAWTPPLGGPAALGVVHHLDTYSRPRQWHSRGALEKVIVHGASTGLSEKALVYLPPQYFAPGARRRHFAALEVLTGYPGNAKQLFKVLHYPGVLRRDMRNGSAQPMILVMMRPSVTFPRDTECTDVPGGPQALSYFTQDIPAAIDAHYRVLPDHWGVIGDSTGGYCAAKIAMTDPSRFHAAVSLSGYFTALHDNTTGNLWGGSPQVRDLNNLDWRLQHQPAPDVAMLVTTSRDEGGPLGRKNTFRFIKLVKPPMTVQTIVEPHGSHTFTTWKPEIPESLAWLSRHLYPGGAAL